MRYIFELRQVSWSIIKVLLKIKLLW